MGIALKNLTQVVVASKIFDFKNFLAEENNRTVIELYCKTSLFRNLLSLIRTFHCTRELMIEAKSNYLRKIVSSYSTHR